MNHMQKKSIEKIKAEIVLTVENILKGSDCDEYLRNHLVKYLSVINNADSLYQTKVANDLLRKYCVDSLDWDSTIFISYREIQKLTRKLGQLLEAERRI
jgi:hypothetical protein